MIVLRPQATDDGGYRSVHSAATRTTPATVLRTGVQGLGEVLITLGVVVLLLAAYQVWGKSAVIASHQDDLDRQLEQSWDSADPTVASAADGSDEEGGEVAPPPPGDAIARLHIPALEQRWVVVEGVSLDDIRYAPGRYPNGAMPGEVGNFAVAGHRNPGTFWDLDRVVAGDTVVVETRAQWHVYRVTRNHIVSPLATEVVAPVPGEPGAAPSEAMLTLTTCHPKWDNDERLIVHAELVDQRPHGEGRPDVLAGTGG